MLPLWNNKQWLLVVFIVSSLISMAFFSGDVYISPDHKRYLDSPEATQSKFSVPSPAILQKLTRQPGFLFLILFLLLSKLIYIPFY